MKIFNSTEEFDFDSCVVTIGAFDGVHLGHISVIDFLHDISIKSFMPSVVLTFVNHPQHYFNKNADFKLLTTLEEKIKIIRGTGIDAVVLTTFDSNTALTNYSNFTQETLLGKLRAKKIVMGYDHHYGQKGEGTFELVNQYAKQLSVEVLRVPELYPGEHLSSSAIRKQLMEGNVSHSAKLLGYNYGLNATVVHGQQLGRKLGFPTANLLPVSPEKLIPAQGVYIVDVLFDKQAKHGILNYGIKPTIDSKLQATIEVHLIDFEGDLYNKTIRVEFLERIRSEMKFDSLGELKNQIEKDKMIAKLFFESREH